MKKLIAIAALMTGLGFTATAQAGAYQHGNNMVSIQAVTPYQAERMRHHQQKQVNTVKIVAAKHAHHAKRAQANKTVVIVKYVKPVVLVQHKSHYKPMRKPSVVDSVTHRVATTHATPVRRHSHY